MSRDAIVAKALSRAGLSYGETPEAYTAFILPLDAPNVADDLADSEASCGLVCEAIMRESECDGAIVRNGRTFDGLRMPYAERAKLLVTVPFQEELARQRGLWVRPAPGLRPEPGCMVTLLGPTHVLTVTGREGDELEVVEGGQSDRKNRGRETAIRLHHKRVVEKGGRLYLQPLDAPGALREVWGWFQAGDLPCL
jgi:hypothetical protein